MPAPALPLQQHPHFADALRLMGRSVEFVDVDGAAPVLCVRQWGQLMASRGPVWLSISAKAEALHFAGLRLMNADIADDGLHRSAGLRRLMTGAYVAELNLANTAVERQAAMRVKWRNAWRRAVDHAPKIKTQRFDTQRHQWLLEADRAQQRSKRFRGLPHDLIHAYSTRHPKHVQVWTVEEGGTPIAAMLFLLHAPVVTYHLGWTDARGRATRAHHAMIMAAANHYADQCFARMDLGLVETDTAPGLARFKIGTGAQVRQLGGTWLRLPGF